MVSDAVVRDEIFGRDGVKSGAICRGGELWLGGSFRRCERRLSRRVNCAPLRKIVERRKPFEQWGDALRHGYFAWDGNNLRDSSKP